MNPEILAIAVRDALDDLRMSNPSISLQQDLQSHHHPENATKGMPPFEIKVPLDSSVMVTIAHTHNPSIAKLLLLLPHLCESAMTANRLEQENAALRARVNQLTPMYSKPDTEQIKEPPRPFSVQAIEDHVKMLSGGKWYVENFGRGVWELYADNRVKIKSDKPTPFLNDMRLHPFKLLSVRETEAFPDEATASFLTHSRNHYVPDLLEQVKAIPGASDLSTIRMAFFDQLKNKVALSDVAETTKQLIAEVITLRAKEKEHQENEETVTLLLQDIVRSLGDRASEAEQSGDWLTLPQTIFTLRRGADALDQVLRMLNSTTLGVVSQVRHLVEKQSRHRDDLEQKSKEVSQWKTAAEHSEIFQKVRVLLGGVAAEDVLQEIQILQEKVARPPVILQAQWPDPAPEIRAFVQQIRSWVDSKTNTTDDKT